MKNDSRRSFVKKSTAGLLLATSFGALTGLVNAAGGGGGTGTTTVGTTTQSTTGTTVLTCAEESLEDVKDYKFNSHSGDFPWRCYKAGKRPNTGEWCVSSDEECTDDGVCPYADTMDPKPTGCLMSVLHT